MIPTPVLPAAVEAPTTLTVLLGPAVVLGAVAVLVTLAALVVGLAVERHERGAMRRGIVLRGPARRSLVAPNRAA